MFQYLYFVLLNIVTFHKVLKHFLAQFYQLGNLWPLLGHQLRMYPQTHEIYFKRTHRYILESKVYLIFVLRCLTILGHSLHLLSRCIIYISELPNHIQSHIKLVNCNIFGDLKEFLEEDLSVIIINILIVNCRQMVFRAVRTFYYHKIWRGNFCHLY